MAIEAREYTLASGLSANVMVDGSGPPLLFLHNHLGRRWDAFLEALSQSFTVYAPRHPGSIEPDELMQLDAFSDLAIYYDDLLAALNVDRAVVVGHGFGGMVAAEFAALFTERVEKLVLMDALGLWLDEQPIPDISALPAPNVASMLSGSAAVSEALLAQPEDPAAVPDHMVHRFLSQAAVSHFIWPIPDRDLRRRLYRITPPTLVLWGADDAYIPPIYADEFVAGLPNAQKALIAGAGHMPHLEATELVLESVTEFVG